MALIIKADLTAGPTIEEAIRECVEFAQRNNVLVETEINDIPMLIAFGGAFGNTVEECTKTFVEQFRYDKKAAFNPKAYYEKMLQDPTVKRIFKERHGYDLSEKGTDNGPA